MVASIDVTKLTQAQLVAYNNALRSYLLQNSLEMATPLYNGTVNPVQTPIINIPLRQVGLVKGFLVEVSVALTNTGSGAAALTDFGAANILSNISFFDLDNYQRINTPGWHLNFLNSAKEGRPFGAADLASSMDSPIAYGNTGSIIAAPATLAATSGSGTLKMMYWVPLAYSKQDLRGSVFMGVVNATAYLQLTINPTLSVTTGDNTFTPYSGANTAVATSAVTITAYQVYLDQLPRFDSGPSVGKPVLPPLDTATQYRLMNTSLTGVTPSSDFAVPFTNFQDFMSATVIYDQAGTRNAGTDINYFSLTTANTLNLFKLDPLAQMLKQRMRIHTDFPKGVYMFDFRDQPISTNQTGNMQLNINPSSAAAGSTVYVGFESFALVNNVLGAASLPSS